jgi:predicted HTH domain antitoxin
VPFFENGEWRIRIRQSLTVACIPQLIVDFFEDGGVCTDSAEIAEISIQEFLVELKKRCIPAYPYTKKEALRELF